MIGKYVQNGMGWDGMGWGIGRFAPGGKVAHATLKGGTAGRESKEAYERGRMQDLTAEHIKKKT